MKTEIKFKYVTLSFHEEAHEGTTYSWAAIDFACLRPSFMEALYALSEKEKG